MNNEDMNEFFKIELLRVQKLIQEQKLENAKLYSINEDANIIIRKQQEETRMRCEQEFYKIFDQAEKNLKELIYNDNLAISSYLRKKLKWPTIIHKYGGFYVCVSSGGQICIMERVWVSRRGYRVHPYKGPVGGDHYFIGYHSSDRERAFMYNEQYPTHEFVELLRQLADPIEATSRLIEALESNLIFDETDERPDWR